MDDLRARGHISDASTTSVSLRFACDGMERLALELLWADLDGDGLEDLLVFVYDRAVERTFGGRDDVRPLAPRPGRALRGLPLVTGSFFGPSPSDLDPNLAPRLHENSGVKLRSAHVDLRSSWTSPDLLLIGKRRDTAGG